ncbi:MlaD family protein [Gordonia sp. MP11Mi]|uniref:MlaD family protein n=1 Tax=Gordonia sp. MP11Mi TaxID=3022769 RepID=UPI003B210BA9
MSIVALIIVGAVSALGIASFGAWPTTGRESTSTLVVAQSNSLVAGSRVLLRGLEVGTVTDVRLVPDGVEIEFRLDESSRVPRDSNFRIEQLSMLGEAYIEISPKTSAGPFVRGGDRIVGDEQWGIGDTVEKISSISRHLDPQAVGAIVAAIRRALPYNRSTYEELRRAALTAAIAFSANTEPFRKLLLSGSKLLSHSDAMATGLVGSGPEVVSTSAAFGSMAMKALAMMDTNDYPRIIKDGPLALFADVQRLLDDVGPDLRMLTQPLLIPVQQTINALRTVDVAQMLEGSLLASADAEIPVKVGER